MSGTYIALRVHPESELLISRYCKENGIPVAYPDIEKRRHVTLFSSDDDFSEAYNLNGEATTGARYYATPNGFAVFPTQNNTSGLVLQLVCPQLVERNKGIAWAYRATDRYPEFKLHCTFTYDAGNTDIQSLPEFRAPIILGDEYCQVYQANWSASK